MSMNRTSLAVACASLLAAVAAGVPTPAHAQQAIKVGVSFQDLNNQYFVTMKDALQKAAAADHVQLIFADAHHDVLKQTHDVEDLIQQGVKLILLNPTDTVGIESAVKEAHKAGVIVVALDANAKGPVDSFVGSKNVVAGRTSCEYLAKALGGKGDVAILDGIPVVPILERKQGCQQALAKYPGIHITSVQNGHEERARGMTVTENMLSANPSLKGIFSVNDTGAMGAFSAINESGRDVKLVSVDGSPEAVQAIQQANSKFIATTAQFPSQMATTALKIGLEKLHGKSIPANVPINVKLIDKSNAASFHW